MKCHFRVLNGAHYRWGVSAGGNSELSGDVSLSACASTKPAARGRLAGKLDLLFCAVFSDLGSLEVAGAGGTAWDWLS